MEYLEVKSIFWAENYTGNALSLLMINVYNIEFKYPQTTNKTLNDMKINILKWATVNLNCFTVYHACCFHDCIFHIWFSLQI